MKLATTLLGQRQIEISISAFPHSITQRRPWLWIAAAVWLIGAAAGLAVLWAYDNAPGESATAPPTWPTRHGAGPGN